MTLRLRFLGIEIASLTVEIDLDDTAPEPTTPADQPAPHRDRWRRQAKRVAAHWALG